MSNERANRQLQELFTITGQTAVVTGGSGSLGRGMALALADAGANVVILGRRAEAAQAVAAEIEARGGKALGLSCDVIDRDALEAAHRQVVSTFGPVDILVNGAGGNHPQATTSPERSFFELDGEAVEQIFTTNFTGTLKCCQVFGREMAERGTGNIINIASMASLRPLTRVVAYSAAKAAITNFTQWLAVHMAQEYSAKIRVNAISPGFFLTEQNRFLLTEAGTGAMTLRGQTILNRTPAGRFGAPEDLIGTLLWLVSPASAFVTGTIIPVDGGFSAFGGV